MNQQQNKRSSKNYKRNAKPAKLLSIEYIALNTDGQIKGNFNKEKELIEFLNNNKNYQGYIFKTYSINNKQITIKNKEK